MESVDLSTADLLTVAGASAVAMVLTQFAKTLFNLAPAITRSVSLVVGLLIVVGVGVTQMESLDVGQAVLLVFVGAQAGLAASAIFDTVRSGLDRQVIAADEPVPDH